MGQELSRTVETYLKIILDESSSSDGGIVPMGALARRMDLTPGTVTTMVKRFAEDGLLEYIPRKGCRLTDKGTFHGVKLLSKHRLLEFFLVDTLKMDWADVHEEAESLEHELSDRVVEALDRFLAYPVVGPHGQPILRTVDEYRAYHPEGIIPLTCAKKNNSYTIVYVDERFENRSLLHFLGEHKLLPGDTIGVLEYSEGGGWIEVRTPRGDVLKIGLQNGEHIHVK